MQELFKNPGPEFRGMPFWSWNNKLDLQQLLSQIDYFKQMGMGGFYIHPRTGLDTKYMGEEFLSIVKSCVTKANDIGLIPGLYDEDRWPSGFGGGLVTENPEFRCKYLVFTKTKNEDRKVKKEPFYSFMKVSANGKGKLIARFDIKLENGLLADYRKLSENESGSNEWYLYLEATQPTPWFNNQSYVNIFNKKATERFLEVIYQKYYETLGDMFGNEVPHIFTDEPHHAYKTTLGYEENYNDVILPYTEEFEQLYKDAYRESFIGHIPEVIWQLKDKEVSQTRYRYHDLLCELLTVSFVDTIYEWCNKHNIMLVGHMMKEENLFTQTMAVGEEMRTYRSFDIPGMDLLCDNREYGTAKQVQSVAHQQGKTRVISELYGVSNWDYDFRGHKLQGDWQAALGITNRVHHHAWVSMEGEAKRDFPAPIFYQSPWYKKYKIVEDHFARISVALTEGKPDVKVGVIHPIESFWLYFGPDEQTAEIRELLQKEFDSVIDWLLFSLIDFDFISEALLKDQQNGDLVGEMKYDVIVVPNCRGIRKTTLEFLEVFAKSGKVVFMGEPPKFVDAFTSQLPESFAKDCINIGFDKISLLEALKDNRQIDIIDKSGTRANELLYQIRDCGNTKWLFVANGKKCINQDNPTSKDYDIIINGAYDATLFDTLTGDIKEVNVTVKDNKTIINHTFYEHDSLLIKLSAFENKTINNADEKKYKAFDILSENFEFSLSEPNVLLLDQAEFSLDDEPFRQSEEVLRIDNILREELGYPLKMSAVAQPWAEEKKEETPHKLVLKYKILSDTTVLGASLTSECPEICNIYFNSKKVDTTITGWYTDKAIKTISLPPISKGESELIIEMPYSAKSNLEWCYVLGNFGVQVMGSSAKIIEMPKTLCFGDITKQGLPFYGGNVTYHCEYDFEQGDYDIEVTKFRAPLLSVRVDGKEIGDIAFSPYKVKLRELKGLHTISITAYGSRINTFGQLHNCDESTYWWGPVSWRTEGDSFSKEYQLKKCGILAAPKINKRHL